MNEVNCKKCKVLNDASLEYCPLCGADLKGGKEGVPGNIFQAKIKFQIVDTFIAWENDTLYAIPMTTVAFQSGGGVVGLASGAAIRTVQENKYKKEVFPLPLDQQVTIQKGIGVKFADIAQVKEKKGFLGVVTIEVYSKDIKPLLVVSGSKPEKENFIQKEIPGIFPQKRISKENPSRRAAGNRYFFIECFLQFCYASILLQRINKAYQNISTYLRNSSNTGRSMLSLKRIKQSRI